MTTQVKTNNQYNINSCKDDLQSSTQMLDFEIEYDRTERQIIYLEKVFKSHLSVIVNPSVDNMKDSK